MNTNVQIQDFIRQCAVNRYPNEACGFIVQKGKKQYAVEVDNESTKPHAFFLINPESFEAVQDQHGEIIAVWHTHVNHSPQPSNEDLEGCEVSALPWLILSVYQRENNQYEFSDFKSIEPCGYESQLIGRPYVFGVFDCWSLVVAYYKQKLSITLNNHYPRYEEFWKKGKPFFSDHYADEGLLPINDVKNLEVGDVLMFQTDNTGEINHVGVYIGDDKFLHHLQGRISKTDIYGGYWQKHTILHLRHNSKC